jgi:hypothetical protein
MAFKRMTAGEKIRKAIDGKYSSEIVRQIETDMAVSAIFNALDELPLTLTQKVAALQRAATIAGLYDEAARANIAPFS